MKSAKSSRGDRKREHGPDATSGASSSSSSTGRKRVRTDKEPSETSGKGDLIKYLKVATDDSEITEPAVVAARIVDAIKSCSSKSSGDGGAPNSYETCLLAARTFPACFRHDEVVDCLMEMVRACSSADLKKLLGATMNITPALFAINLLSNAYQDVEEWPLSFVELWLEDAASNRCWVEDTNCSLFVENLRASFETKNPPPNLSMNDSASGSTTPLRKDADSDELLSALRKQEEETDPPAATLRYSGKEMEVGNIIVNSATELVLKKPSEIPKNLLKTLISSCGLTPVRVYVVAHIEQWIHNPKCSRQAQQLLLSLCVNSNCNTSADAEVVVEISKLKIKSKQMSQFFASAIKEMVKDNESNMRNVISQIIYNELSLSRNTNNLVVLGTIIPSSPDAFGIFAEVIFELLQKKDDFLPAIRLILREIQRASRFECSLVPFVQGLLKTRDHEKIIWRDTDVRDRAFKSITELVLVAMFLSCPPGLRGDDRDPGPTSNFLVALAKIQEDALRWMYMDVPKIFKPARKDYLQAYNKLSLKDTADLQTRDGFPSENERAVFSKLCVRTTFSEEAVMWLLFHSFNSSVTKEQNLALNEILEYTEYFIMRAAAANALLPMQKLEIIEFLFRLSQYRHPDNIILPIGYDVPKLAITKNLWRVWSLLCVIASNNPSTLGKVGFESYPTLRALMEMCMTNHFAFPTPSSMSMEDIMVKERQIAAKEKEQILEFEGYLAAASSKNVITEKSSLLLSQLMSLDPLGPCRCPPSTVLTHLQSLNERLRLGHNLCRSRNPDFLVDLIQRNSQPILNRLSELVAEGSFEALPVQCLCEFLLGQAHRLKKLVIAEGQSKGADTPEKSFKSISKVPGAAKEDLKSIQLISFLKDIIHGSAAESVKEVLEYFCIRLYSSKSQNRTQALQALELLFWSSQNSSDNWLIDGLPNIRAFNEIQEMLINILRKALGVESEPAWVCRYIEYLSTWGFAHSDSEIDKIAYDVSHLLVERNCVASLILSANQDVYQPMFDIFINFLRKMQIPAKGGRTSRNSQEDQNSDEEVLLKWEGDKKEATINVLIIQAIMVLLSSYSYYTPKGGTGKKESHAVERRHKELMDTWFGTNWQENSPKGFLLNSPDEAEAIIYPDWIKLRMIRSSHPRLLHAALVDVNVEQLLLYIQSFGIPTASVSALLVRLDVAVENNMSNVMESLTDAKYMKTLVEIHKNKGAKGGEAFYRFLQSIVSGDESKDQDQSVNTQQMTSLLPQRKQIPLIAGHSSNNYYSKTLTSSGHSKSKPTELKTIINLLTSKNGSPESLGHLVDNFLQVEPCAIQNAQDGQLSLLLGRTKSQTKWRPLLLTVLIHESNWGTVQECIQTCLGTFNASTFDSGAVLDLVSATISNPKLWQGRDKFISKRQGQSLALRLDRNQISNLALYIMDELNPPEVNGKNNFSISNILCSSPPETTPHSNHKQGLCIQDRVKLWIKCCTANDVPVSEALQFIFSVKSSGPSLVKFLGEVYYEYPEVITKLEFPEHMEKFSEGQSTSVIDNITHSLMYAVANVQPSKEFKKMAAEIDQFLRKMASTHPLLLVRQLDLMRALLEGRCHLQFSSFHSNQHQIPFQIFLGLLELIQPSLANKMEKMKSLKSIMELYIKVFYNYGLQKDYSISLGKFAIFIQKLLRTNQTGIRELLAVHYEYFRELAQCQFYEELEPLHNLMNSLVPPKSGSELSFLTSENSESNVPSTAAAVDITQSTSRHQELIPFMQELDYVATRHPSVLGPFSHVAAPLVRSDNDACRSQAFALILKHMTSSPESSQNYLEPVLKAWATKEGFCTNNLLKRFNEFIVLSQENGEWLFKELFNVGVTTSNLHVSNAIMRTIEFLRARRMQT